MSNLGLGFLIESMGGLGLLLFPIMAVITWKKIFLILSLISFFLLISGFTITIL